MTRISQVVLSIPLVVILMVTATGCTQTHTVGLPSDQVRFSNPTRPNQPPLALNDRIKVSPMDGPVAVGRLIELTPEMLYLGEGPQFATDEIRQLHVSWGTSRLGTKGMIYGMLLGVGLGVTAGLIFNAEPEETAAAALAIGLGGMLSGYWAGQVVVTEKWKEVDPVEWRQP